MAYAAHYRTAAATPIQIILMTAPALLVIGHQQRHRNILFERLLVATGALAAFTEVSVGEYIKIVVAHPATQDRFMQVVVKLHRRLIVLTKPLAFQVHDAGLPGFFGPCMGCGQDTDNDQNQNEMQMLCEPHPRQTHMPLL